MDEDASMKGVSVIIPVYNEEKIIEKNTAKLVRFLGSKGVRFEIIIASNGSTDRTPEIAVRMGKKDARVRSFHVPECGVGTAFVRGVSMAKYPKLVSLDMDLSTDLSFVGKALALLDDYDAVVGSKKMGSQTRPFLRRLASMIYIAITKIFLRLEFTDYSIGAKAFRRKSVKNLMGSMDAGSFYVVQLLYRMRKRGLRMKEIPVVCDDRRKSKFNIILESYYRFVRLLAFVIFESARSINIPRTESR